MNIYDWNKTFFSAVLLVHWVVFNCIWKVLCMFSIPVSVIMAIGIIPVGIKVVCRGTDESCCGINCPVLLAKHVVSFEKIGVNSYGKTKKNWKTGGHVIPEIWKIINPCEHGICVWQHPPQFWIPNEHVCDDISIPSQEKLLVYSRKNVTKSNILTLDVYSKLAARTSTIISKNKI